MVELKFYLRSFEELQISELYDIMAIRQEVFVVEQDCPYQDADYRDQMSLHVLAKEDSKLVGYTRLVPKGISYSNYPSIGRVVVSKDYRNKGIGDILMLKSINWAVDKLGEEIKISAQVYAINFYKRLGFKVVGDEYLEDNIPHVGMVFK